MPEKEENFNRGENGFGREEIRPESTELGDYSGMLHIHFQTLNGDAPNLPPGVCASPLLCIDADLLNPSAWNPNDEVLQAGSVLSPVLAATEAGAETYPREARGGRAQGQGDPKQRRKWSLINASTTKNGQGLSFVSLFVTLQCGFDYST